MASANSDIQRAVELHSKDDWGGAEVIYRSVLERRPTDFDANHLLGVLYCQKNNHKLGIKLIQRALLHNPTSVEALINLGWAHQQLHHADDALQAYQKALKLKPNHLRAQLGHANCLEIQKRHEAALNLYNDAARSHPKSAELWNNRGITLASLTRYADAISSYDAALSLDSRYAHAFNNKGLSLFHLGRHQEAITTFDSALNILPSYAEAWHNRGLALAKSGNLLEATSSFRSALRNKGGYPEALNGLGNVLGQLHLHQEAITVFRDLLHRFPNNANAANNLGGLLANLNCSEEAISLFDRALAIRPDFAEAHNNKGIALAQIGKHREALTCFDSAFVSRPTYGEAWHNKGVSLRKLGRLSDAIQSFSRALQLAPNHPYALGELIACELASCHWDRVQQLTERLEQEPKACIAPFTTLALDLSAEQQRNHAERFTRSLNLDHTPIKKPISRAPNSRIVIAYLSSDYHEHATAYLMTELIEKHNRSKFKVIGISWGPDDNSLIRHRLKRAFDQFIDVRGMTDREIATLLVEIGVDVAIDLKGHTTDARPGIFAHRPATTQISYLGFPGTMGATFIDFIIADATVLPLSEQLFYAEKIIHLPHSYQVNDSQRLISKCVSTKRQEGLPEDAFVFCCFNNTYKISKAIFESWSRILNQVDGSVLWLLAANAFSMETLRNEASRLSLDPNRLVFAPRLKLDEHLARHQHADLFLDTTPYNAHTTCSDALWSGLPVLTLAGKTFASRVAASLLNTSGLSELVTTSFQEYETRAARLANTPEQLRRYKDILMHSKKRGPLFNTDKFCHDYEDILFGLNNYRV